MIYLAGIDIGGTKCAVSLGKIGEHEDRIEIIDKVKFPTPGRAQETIHYFIHQLDELIKKHRVQLTSIGISCGGPLHSKTGMILSPPNLPGWDHIDIITPFQKHFGIQVGLQNDANACALAEWKWGAGRGCQNMVFLTFGTGMGAGLILDGRLYAGTNDMAGEVGHMRMASEGPIGFGKAGSFEGFCSGGGITQLAKMKMEKLLQAGKSSSFCRSFSELEQITTQKVGEAAQQGDAVALEIFHLTGIKLGAGLAILVDILNPERIVIGSIYARQQQILEPIVLETLRQEAIPLALDVCEIVPAGLGEQVGDYASLSVAMYQINQ